MKYPRIGVTISLVHMRKISRESGVINKAALPLAIVTLGGVFLPGNPDIGPGLVHLQIFSRSVSIGAILIARELRSACQPAPITQLLLLDISSLPALLSVGHHFLPLILVPVVLPCIVISCRHHSFFFFFAIRKVLPISNRI